MGYVTLLRMSARLAAIASALVCAAATVVSRARRPPPARAPTSRWSSRAAPANRRASAASARPSSTRCAPNSAAAPSTRYGVNYPADLRLPRPRPTAPTTRPTTSARWSRSARARGSCSAGTRRAPRSSTCWPASRRSATRSATVGSAPAAARGSRRQHRRGRRVRQPVDEVLASPSPTRSSAAGPSTCARTATRSARAAATRSHTATTSPPACPQAANFVAGLV